jgi:predicted NBD/HSP70 family sugar kinase
MQDVPRGGSLANLREANRRRAVSLLRLRGGMTQAEISRATGLSHASVSNIVRDLVDQGTVSSTAVRRNGRRAFEITLSPSSGLVVGIDFGNRHVRVAVADLAHTVLAESHRTLLHGHRAELAIETASTMLCELMQRSARDLKELQVLVAGLPGPLNPHSGRIVSPSILPGWADLDVKSALAARFELPVVVDNDANLGALAEGLWGRGRGLTDFAYLKVSTGIGAGLVLGGHLYRGAAGTAGEIGHTTIEEDGAVCRCGNRGCLETLAGGPALLDLLRPGYGEKLTIEDVLRLSDAGDIGCRRVITDAGRHIGVAVANLCNLLSPQLIIVGGELALAGDVLLDAMRDSMARRAVTVSAQTTEVVTGVLAERTGVLGAVALALQESDRAVSAPFPESVEALEA